MVHRAFLSRMPEPLENVHAIKTECNGLDEAAAQYEGRL